jgi:hypothetical protein
MPIEVYEQWKRARAEFFTKWRETAERAGHAPEEAAALGREATAAAI